MLRIALVAALVALAAPRPAEACAVGSPCTKYRVQRVTEPVSAYTTYGAPPARFDRARITRYLAGRIFRPVKVKPTLPVGVPLSPNVVIVAALPIKFVSASDAALATAELRQVLIRRIEQSDGVTMIEVDDEVWTLGACKNRKYTCLTPRSDLTFDPEPSFAVPPP